jgi:hypothetical protein
MCFYYRIEFPDCGKYTFDHIKEIEIRPCQQYNETGVHCKRNGANDKAQPALEEHGECEFCAYDKSVVETHKKQLDKALDDWHAQRAGKETNEGQGNEQSEGSQQPERSE